MKKRLLSVILLLAMLLSTISVLGACDGGEDDTTENNSGSVTETQQVTESGTESDSLTETSGSEAGSDSDTESDDVSGSETESGAETETVSETATETETVSEETTTQIDVITDIYDNGGVIADAGIKWEEDVFALTDYKIDEAAAVTKTAAEMLALLQDKQALAQGEVYKVTEPLVLSSDTKYYGNLAAIIAEGGIVIENAEKIVIKELLVKGNISVKNSSGITFFKLDLKAGNVGVTIDEASYNVAFKNCKVSASDTAIVSDSELLSVFQSYISADKGIVSTGDSFAVQNTRFDVKSLGVSTSGAYCTVRNNLIEADQNGIGVDIKEGSTNGLAALNVINNAQLSVQVNSGFNCVVLLNSAITIKGENTTNLYVVENNLGGAIELQNNVYLLCDGNTFVKDDGKKHPIINKNNSEINGDNVHNVNERLEFGANEELVPHTNKELFVGMERRSSVRDVSLTKNNNLTAYVRSMARQSSVVIVPPGAYSVNSSIVLDGSSANTTLYAFGVYEEKNAVADGADRPDGTVYETMGVLLEVTGPNITVKGLTMGYDFQSSGQAYILEKMMIPVQDGVDKNGDPKYVDMPAIRIVTSAGYYEGFADSDTSLFATGVSVTSGDMNYPWINNLAHKFISQEEDGTIILQITHNQAAYDLLQPGDILGCRLEGDNHRSISLLGTNAYLKDCVLYGYSAALAVVSSGRDAKNVRLERFHNTSKPAPIIDEDTYNRYKKLEEEYGLTSDGNDPLADGAQGLEVYIDEHGNYRGGLPRYSSVDGTHITGAAQGTSATSCIFEHMVDDASNQRSSSSRIAGIHDNGNGTHTLYYKASLAQVYFNINTNTNGATTAGATSCPKILTGDTVFAYASNGHVLIEAPVIEGATFAGQLPDDCHMVHVDGDNDCKCDLPSCLAPMHYDQWVESKNAAGLDCKCDKCGVTVHTDYTASATANGLGDGLCNNSYYNQCTIEDRKLVDANQDGYNDADGGYIIKDMAPAGATSYRQDTSQLSWTMIGNHGGKQYIITYSTYIYALLVNSDDLDLGALEGYDFTDNDYFMEEKILCDNISLNSTNFTFDNVLMQNYHSRGILMKTRDATVKNCTFRNVAYTGMLLSIETTWGESTVPKNITLQDCLFDNTGHTYGAQTNLKYAPVSIQGLGDLSDNLKDVSVNSLPCENINIIHNKFINTNNNYVITISAARNVTIKDNILEGRTDVDPKTGERVENKVYGKAVYIDGCMDVEISGNTYLNFDKYKDDEKNKMFVFWNYKNVGGTDIEGIVDENGNRVIPESNDTRKP